MYGQTLRTSSCAIFAYQSSREYSLRAASTVLWNLQMPLVNLTDIEIHFNFAGIG
jgi:hypothetical protein